LSTLSSALSSSNKIGYAPAGPPLEETNAATLFPLTILGFNFNLSSTLIEISFCDTNLSELLALVISFCNNFSILFLFSKFFPIAAVPMVGVSIPSLCLLPLTVLDVKVSFLTPVNCLPGVPGLIFFYLKILQTRCQILNYFFVFETLHKVL
jgi:hypothetical protein